jgi:septum formation protein
VDAAVKPSLILASGSQVRARILKDAGFSFRVVVADVDESQIQDACPVASAQKRAELKAIAVAMDNPDAVVIGCDQICFVQNKILHKAKSADEMRERLKLFRTMSHELISAVCVVKKDQILTAFYDTARLYVRSTLTDEEIDAYIRDYPQDWQQSSGGYRLEGAGSRLFSHVAGDFFSILGLPLFKLQAALRSIEVNS